MVGGLYILTAIANGIQSYLFMANNIPVIIIYNTVTQVFTFSNTTVHSTFTLTGLILPT